MLRLALVIAVIAFTTSLVAAQSRSRQDRPIQSALKVPTSITIEHHEIHEQLNEAMRTGGKTGKAAEALEQRLMPHFMREEEYAMPQLGLLELIAKRQAISNRDRKRAIALSDRLRRDYRRMLQEHGQIVKLLDAMKQAALEEKKPAQVEFVEKLKNHARNEEEVLYPAALLIGERLRSR